MPEYHFDKDNPHTKGEPTIREPTGVDATDQIKSQSPTPVSATTKLEKQ
jgi:hypothetical protein